MKINRREFLKITGAATLVLATDSIADVLSNSDFIEALPAEKGGIEGKRWGMLVDVEKCTKAASQGCRKCVEACRKENNIPVLDDPRRTPEWIKIVKVKNEFDDSKELYVPLLCNHCEHAPCVQVCPTQASFRRKDGIVLIDSHRCIGCRYCMVACPYNARNWNFKNSLEVLKEINPEVPRRSHGVVEKCTFCFHRVDKAVEEGKSPVPACVEACPEKALVFGDLNDPNSEISKMIKESRVYRLREYLGTEPSVYYKNLR